MTNFTLFLLVTMNEAFFEKLNSVRRLNQLSASVLIRGHFVFNSCILFHRAFFADIWNLK